MAYKIYSFKAIFESGMKVFADNDCEVIFSKGHSVAETMEELKQHDFDGIFTRTDAVTKEMIDACPNLKVIAKQGVGVDNIALDYAAEKGVQVVFAPRENGNAVAEHTVMLMLGAARQFSHVDSTFRGGNFDVRYTLRNTFELKGKTLGLLGCGNIGQQVAKKAADGFEMEVIGYDPYAKQENMWADVTLVKDRDEVLARADFLSIHTPLTPETRGSIGMEDFKKMKNTAILVNAGRGEVLDEPALIQALQDGTILGVGLDVFATEPLPMDSPFMTMPQAFITPHTAATTEEAIYRTALVAAEGVIEVLDKKPITWPANKLK